MPIARPDDLREHLQWAVEVELSTVPPYLYAMYSIEDAGSTPYRLVRSVVVEEMLHAALVANLLTAVGGRPRFADPAAVPSYPMDLPHHEPALTLHLEPASTTFVERVCMPIERPRPAGAPPEDDRYETLGQFYEAIEVAIERLDEGDGLFADPRPDHQLASPGYYAPVEFDVAESGGLHPVTDRESAIAAVETVVHQGEGLRDEHYADPGHRELTHHDKFRRIAEGEFPLGDVRPVAMDPTAGSLPPDLRPVADLFDASYSYCFLLLEALYAPLAPHRESGLVRDLYTLMSGVLRPVARYLTRQPTGPDGGPPHAGPTFDYVEFPTDVSPAEFLAERGHAAAADHPELTHVTDALATLRGLPSRP